MSKEINLEEASSWDREETLNNIKYLEDRGRYEEAAPLREQAGLDPHEEGASNPDIELLLREEQSVTSRFGTNDTPEYDPETDPKTKVKVGRTQDPTGEVGPHGANSDQTVPDDDERNTKNRSEGDSKRNSRSANVSGGSGGGGKKSRKESGDE